MRVTTLMSLAVVLVVVGTLLLVIYGLGQSEPAVVQAANAVSSGSPAGPYIFAIAMWDGIIVIGVGAILAASPAASRRSTRTA